MKTVLESDAANRIELPSELQLAAGFPPGQKLIVSVTPGRIVLEREPEAQNEEGRVERRGKFKVWTGPVPNIPLSEAVALARHYTR